MSSPGRFPKPERIPYPKAANTWRSRSVKNLPQILPTDIRTLSNHGGRLTRLDCETHGEPSRVFGSSRDICTHLAAHTDDLGALRSTTLVGASGVGGGHYKPKYAYFSKSFGLGSEETMDNQLYNYSP